MYIYNICNNIHASVIKSGVANNTFAAYSAYMFNCSMFLTNTFNIYTCIAPS